MNESEHAFLRETEEAKQSLIAGTVSSLKDILLSDWCNDDQQRLEAVENVMNGYHETLAKLEDNNVG